MTTSAPLDISSQNAEFMLLQIDDQHTSKFTSSQIMHPVAGSEVVQGAILMHVSVNKRYQNQAYITR